MNILLLAVAMAVQSPDGRNAIAFEDGARPHWNVTRDARAVTGDCDFGLVLGKQPGFGPLKVVSSERRELRGEWRNRFGGNERVVDNANELTVVLEESEAPKRRLGAVLRAYDEGVAFRYFVPPQAGMHNVVVEDELTTFRFPGDPLCWYAAYDCHEVAQEGEFLHRSLRSLGPREFAGIPVLVETGAGFAAICEADVTDWGGAFLRYELSQKPADCSAFRIDVSKAKVDAIGGIAAGLCPLRSPWRVMILADDELGLIRNKDLVLNLNPPPAGGDAAFAWVEPGASSWDWWYNSNNDISKEQILGFIDFAAEMGWRYHTIDAGWYGRPAGAPGIAFEPLPELDLPGCLAHAKEKGVGIFLWVHWLVLDSNGIDETFEKFERWGVKGVKIDFHCRQDGFMVRWYEKVCRLAAKHHLLVNFHAPMHPTGANRTWPNQITREAVRGNEISKWEIPSDAMNPATLVFSRFLVGPGDFTPGGVRNVHARGFVSQMDRGHRYADSSPESRAMSIFAEEIGSRAHALALTVAVDSPLMTLCDSPAHYRAAPEAKLLRSLPAAWRRTLPLAGRIGSHYAVAREAFDGRFYVAAITVGPRKLALDFSFLGDGEYTAEIVRDDPGATPADANAAVLETRRVRRGDRLEFELVAEGGLFIRLEK